MKNIQEYEDEICRYDMTWVVKNAARSVMILYHFKTQIQQFSEENPYSDLDIAADSIKLSTEERHTTLSFLKIFGGTWKKEVNNYWTNRIDYVQEIPHPFKHRASEDDAQPMFTFLVTSPPPPSCKVEDYEVEVPATKVTKKRIVCPQSVEDEVKELEQAVTTPIAEVAND